MATASYSCTPSTPFAFFSDAMTRSCMLHHVLEIDMLEKIAIDVRKFDVCHQKIYRPLVDDNVVAVSTLQIVPTQPTHQI
jgi:hypothetical protein